MPVTLIVNADDLGLAACVNRGVAKAHTDGILTSATLMANGPAFDGGVAVARQHPELGIGVHLNAVRGAPVADVGDVSPLLGPDNRFRFSSWSLGGQLRKRAVLVALEVEYRAQIERVLAAGLKPGHLDSEKHHAVWKPIEQILERLALEYGIPSIRNLKEPAWLAWRHLPRPRWRSVLEAAALRTYTQLRSVRRGVRRPDFFFGQTHIGEMSEAVWLRLIPILPEGVSEVMVHPGERDEEDLAAAATAMGPSWIDPQRPVELSALLSDAVRESLRAHDVQLATFAALSLQPGGRAGHNRLGADGEDLAVRHLKDAGYAIVARNVSLTRGEIDVVAREGGDLVFVEVKTRAGEAFGSAAESLGPGKLRSLARAAQEYLHRNGLHGQPVRLDLVAITAQAAGPPSVELLRDAAPLGDVLGD